MSKAVISTGGKQYLVSEGETIDVEKLDSSKKTVEFTPLLTIADDKVSVGTPEVTGAKVTAEIVEPLVKGDKVTSIRYKAKKRVNKTKGHRQQYSRIKIKKISNS